MGDPGEVSATELSAAYSQRWEIEQVFDELKTHQRGPRTVLRSKSPDLVLKEIWGHLCRHWAIRSLMAEAASHSGRFPPDQHGRDSPAWLYFLRRLLARLNPTRRSRSAPRVIKRKYVKWHVKRAHHTNWPNPEQPPIHTVYLAN